MRIGWLVKNRRKGCNGYSGNEIDIECEQKCENLMPVLNILGGIKVYPENRPYGRARVIFQRGTEEQNLIGIFCAGCGTYEDNKNNIHTE
jgi:hypothetical protein